MLPINGPRQQNTIAQDAPGTIFSRGAATLVSPFFDHAYPRRRCLRVNVIRKFRTVEDGVDAAVPVDAQNAPTSDLENCKERSFPQRPHRSLFLEEEKKNEEELHVCQSDCLNRGGHPMALCQNCVTYPPKPWVDSSAALSASLIPREFADRGALGRAIAAASQ